MHIEIVGNWYCLTMHTLHVCMTLSFANKIVDYNKLQQSSTSTMLNEYYVCINILVLYYLLQIFFNFWYCLPVPSPWEWRERFNHKKMIKINARSKRKYQKNYLWTKSFLYGNIYQDHYTRESKLILMLDQHVHIVHGIIKIHKHCQTQWLTQRQFQGYHFCATTVTCTYTRNVLTVFMILQVCYPYKLYTP